MIFLAQGIDDISKLIGISDNDLKTIILVGLLVIVLQSLALIRSAFKDRGQSNSLLGQSMEVFSNLSSGITNLNRGIAKLVEVSEANTQALDTLSERQGHTEHAVISLSSRNHPLRTGVEANSIKLDDIQHKLIKTSKTMVVVRDAKNKKIIASFSAEPRTLKNGKEVLVVDMFK